MKKLFTSLLLACSIGAVHAQDRYPAPNLSALTRQYMYAAKQLQGRDKIVPNYVYKIIGGKRYISAFIKVYDGLDAAQLAAVGAFVGTKAGRIWTVQIPVDRVDEFVAINGINCIDFDTPIFPTLDAARKYTKADSAQMGIGLTMPMSGKDVVVGIIDAGFDFTHPTLYDTLHGAYRVKRVWNQKVAGTPPPGYAYGNEMTDSNVIRAKGYDTTITSHGTHVAGIAAGSGYGSNVANSRFRGMAYASDLVLVGIMPDPAQWVSAGVTDVMDGTQYIFDYAASVGKPAVVNLSWGSSIGPHDGYSLFSQALDAITGAGKIFVCSAGNSGQDTIHLGKTFTATDTMVSTFVTFDPSLDTFNQKTWVDVWGDTGKAFCVNFKLYNGAAAVDSTPWVCVSGTTQLYNMIGSNGDTCTVSVSVNDTDINGRPHAIVYLYSHRVPDNICMNIKATTGSINAWEGYIIPPSGYYGALKKLGYSFAVSGDVNKTVGDLACARSAITVGAYATKISFTNILGQTLSYGGSAFRIAPFSSLGPTADNRIKPDIAGPGFGVVSAVSSYDPEFLSTGSGYQTVVAATTIGPKTYNWAIFAGTSMSSPCVSGIVAMMLQVYPGLTPDSAKTIIANTAIQDTYTGVLPASGNNIWGHGKINAYKALKFMAGATTVSNTLTKDPLDCVLYPNPNHGGFTIDYTSNIAEQLKVEVFDITGKLVSTHAWGVQAGANSKTFDHIALARGTYFTKISSANGGTNTIKMTVE